MSLSLSIAGIILTIFAINNDDLRKKNYHIIYGFYTCMEILQTIQYMYVNDCKKWQNPLLTNIAYVLVIVQPLLWNTVLYHNTSDIKYKHIFKLAIILCIVWIGMNIFSRINYTPEDNKDNNCGLFNNTETCTYRKNDSHLYWKWTTRNYTDITANYFMYLCLWFIPALIVPSTRFTGIFLITGCIFAIIFTYAYGTNIIEFPSTWCLLSVPLLIFGYFHMIFTRIGIFKRLKL